MLSGKQKVTSPKTSNPRSKKQASFEAPEPSELPSVGTDSNASTGAEDVAPKPKPEPADGIDDGGDNVFESDSSESDDDDEVTGLTEEEEKERQREKREKVSIGMMIVYKAE